MRVAAIDIGTNSVLLLIAEQRGHELVALAERAVITRLGRGVDATRKLDPAAAELTLACLAQYASEIERAGATRVAAVGTSAMRDATGGEAFQARATELLGVAPRVISGDEEAQLTFSGALTGIALEGPVIVFDLGGGSTEVIRGNAGVSPTVEQAASLDVGSVRLTERHVSCDPPSPDELAAVRRDTRDALATLGAGWARSSRLVGVAGTVTTLAACALKVVPYDANRIHGARLTADAVAHTTATLARVPLAERRAVPAVDPSRADVIVAGGIIVEEILDWAGASELWVSDRGVRWGLAKRLASGG